MGRGCFITGTDTGVGKTAVTAAILRALRLHGMNAATMKPVQTGAAMCDGMWLAPDLALHHAGAAFWPPVAHMRLMQPYCYEPACSPHLAGRMAGHYPDLARIEANARELLNLYDVLLIEGAGGVYAPLTETETTLDLMKRLAMPVILVARRGLGTINHTLLTLHALRDAGLAVAGVNFNETENVPVDFIRADNPRAVEAFGKVPILGNMDFLPDFDTDPAKALQGSEKFLPGLATIFPELG
jgi:dethiobiotin synthetase